MMPSMPAWDRLGVDHMLPSEIWLFGNVSRIPVQDESRTKARAINMMCFFISEEDLEIQL